MGKAELLVDEILTFNDNRFVALVKVFKVAKGPKFPDGFKVRCVLLDTERDVPILLLDNHEPHGYHVHTKLPEDKDFRVSIIVKGYVEAVDLFLKEARKVVADEK